MTDIPSHGHPDGSTHLGRYCGDCPPDHRAFLAALHDAWQGPEGAVEEVAERLHDAWPHLFCDGFDAEVAREALEAVGPWLAGDEPTADQVGPGTWPTTASRPPARPPPAARPRRPPRRGSSYGRSPRTASSATSSPRATKRSTRSYDGAPPAEIDGMPVRAAFPTPPPDDDSMEHWTVILTEPQGPDGCMYRVCRVRRAGAGWEVFDGLPGAQDLTWMLAALWFASAVQAEADSAEPPLQEDRTLPR